MPKSTATELRKQVREDYLQGKGTCRELAEKHGLPHTTVENWCRRERWRSKLTEIDRRLTAETEHSLVKHADNLVARRAEFLERSLAEAEALLDRIQEERGRLAPGDLDALRKLVQCWKPVIEMQRRSLGLDEPQEKKNPTMFHLQLGFDEPPLIKTIEAADCGSSTADS